MNEKKEPIIVIKNIYKNYKSGEKTLHILKDLNFEIFKGEIILIIGKSGTGKTTLLNILGSLDSPDKGDIIFKNKSILNMKERELAKFRNSSIGFVFQLHHLLEEFNAIENIMLPGLIFDNNYKEIRKKAKELLKTVDLINRADHFPSQLSGGERQRIAIARALINNPDVVLADEPTGDLDPANAKNLMNLFKNLNNKFAQTFLIVSHDRTLLNYATKTLELKEGKVKEISSI